MQAAESAQLHVRNATPRSKDPYYTALEIETMSLKTMINDFDILKIANVTSFACGSKIWRSRDLEKAH
jgi:hypothetical protein